MKGPVTLTPCSYARFITVLSFAAGPLVREITLSRKVPSTAVVHAGPIAETPELPDGPPYEQPGVLGLVGLPFGSVDAGSPRKKKKVAPAAAKDEAPTAAASPAGKQRKKA